MKFAVFASGYGSNLQAIIEAVGKKKIQAELALVVADQENARALQRAKDAGIKTQWIDPRKFPERESFDREAIRHLEDHQIDFIVLAGFMRILSGHFIDRYPGKILNIHPSLLPAFPGAQAIRDAFEARVSVTGVTVHFVEEKVDVGPIIRQEEVAISPQDTLECLEEKIHQVEHQLYPKVIELYVQGKIKSPNSHSKP